MDLWITLTQYVRRISLAAEEWYKFIGTGKMPIAFLWCGDSKKKKKKLLDRSLSFILIGIILCPLHALYNITSEFLHAKTVRMHLYIIMWYSAKCLGTRSAQLHHHSSASLLIVSFSAEIISSVREQGILALVQTCSQQA